ncbi:pantetheinase-like [Panonychus citri]|uniref:pantetheinase-like n=1 Tax=Panonychus citri TaxID=50023 RepID=UPI0023079700|nr:pantetheinase-like [Panonychus citri]
MLNYYLIVEQSMYKIYHDEKFRLSYSNDFYSSTYDIILWFIYKIFKPLIMFRFLFFVTVTSICFLYGISISTNVVKSDNSTFRAAVYEYQRYNNLSINGLDLLQVKRINLNSYSKAIQVASQHGANIIVFPESGLFGVANRLYALANYEYIPKANESITPCIDWPEESVESRLSFSVYSLSCLAKNFNIYIAAILGEKIDCSPIIDTNCPDDGHYLYNTQILFDSTGKLIAKYHKTHLFFEAANNIPREPEIVTVSTPFGKLGFLICFDIHFEQPALSLIYTESVDTILFGAHWIDESPFLNAHRVQSGFAIEHNVNLLAAGINDLINGAMGSGIYVAGEGPIIYTADITKSGSKLLIADIPKSKRLPINEDNSYFIEREDKFVKLIENVGSLHEQSINTPYAQWTLELDLFDSTKLSQQSGTITSCTEELICCQVDYSLKNPTFISTYYLLVKRWIRPTTKICEQFCGLVAYNITDYSYTSTDIFSYLRLTGTFSGNLSIPSVITNNLQLISKTDWIYAHKDNVAVITINNSNQPIVAATLYSRYEKDDQPIG